MDFSMPVCDGPTGSKLIRKVLGLAGIDPEDQPIICCVSAYSQKQYQEVAKASGMDEFLIKPVFKIHLHKMLIKAKLISWWYQILSNNEWATFWRKKNQTKPNQFKF